VPAVTVILILLIATIGPASVIGLVGYAALKALLRNPSAARRIFASMIVAFIFAEVIALIALLVVVNLFR
jgi:F0F1-type ATP synthase membrane subunit c/vacuolar-type H+-ATPase subunit K